MSDCLFCGIVAGDVPAEVVLRTDDTVAFRDINPAAPVHVLVVPVRHIDNAAAVGDGDAETVLALMTAARQVAEREGIAGPDRGYRLIINVGPDALNSVPHLHVHVMGGTTLSWPIG